MLTRYAVVLSLAVMGGGCANDAPNLAGFAAVSALAVATPPAVTGAIEQEPPRKTMSDRVLAAIALERVTGLKPDPARFAE